MEKIYIEQEQQNQQQQQRQQKHNKKFTSLNVSLGLSFAVAFVAIASILFVSLSGKSYAANNDGSIDQITTAAMPTQSVWPNNYTATVPTPGSLRAPLFKATVGSDTKDVYCLESNIDFVGNTVLNKDKPLDGGMIYLNMALKNLDIPSSDDPNGYIRRWISQTAVWSYMGLIGDSNSAEVSNPEQYFNVVKATTQVCLGGIADACTSSYVPSSASGSLYEKYGVDEIVTKAVQYHNQGISSLSLIVNKTGSSFTLSEDEKSYVSPKLNVSMSGTQSELNALQYFNLVLKGAPEGSYIQGITADGEAKTIKDTDELTLSTYKEFYVIVPKDKVTEKNKKFVIEANGTFKTYGGYYYVADGAQSVTTVEEVPYTNSNGTDLEVVYTPNVPDTALNTSRSIYLIGLIVLLSGLGILYVNVKKQQKQN